jgi:hypothetical protein
MDEKMKEIETSWPYLFPLDKTKGELSDCVIKANHHIKYLLLRIKELEERAELAEATRDDALAYVKMYEARVRELEGGLKDIINFSSNYSVFARVADMRDELKKLIEKENKDG